MLRKQKGKKLETKSSNFQLEIKSKRKGAKKQNLVRTREDSSQVSAQNKVQTPSKFSQEKMKKRRKFFLVYSAKLELEEWVFLL